MRKTLNYYKALPDIPHEWLMLATIFLLMLLNFLNVGMIAFAASPLMGELGVSPQEYSLSTASYAAVAVVAISKQRWLVERIGWRIYILASLLIFFIGCFICYVSHNYTQFLIGHIAMGLGGASFMNGARIIMTLFPIGPIRFTALKSYAYGLTIGIASSPFLVAYLLTNSSWNNIFIVLMALCILIAITASFCLPGIPPKNEVRSQSHPYLVMALATGSFLTLYAFRSGIYEFYSNTVLICVIVLLGFTSFYYFFRSMIKNHHASPLLSIKELFSSKRYRSGILVFFTCYLVMGSNSYLLPQVLQKGLGFGWSTVGKWYALGLTSMIIGLWIHLKIFPKRPHGKKFFMTGFFCIGCYGFFMAHLSPSADMQTYIFPCIALYGFFSLFLQGTAASKSFSELDHDETMFSHAQQLKNMISQIGQSMGIALASIGLQWRTTAHYNVLNNQIVSSDPAYQKVFAQLAAQYGKYANSDTANQMALSWIKNLVKQQSILLAGIDYFTLLFFLGIIGFVIMFFQKRLN